MNVEFPMPARPLKVVYWARWADATGAVTHAIIPRPTELVAADGL